jgi:hypothetical protein
VYLNSDHLGQQIAKGRERLAASKQRLHRIHMGMFNLKKLNSIECKEKYRVEVTNNVADLDAEGKLIVLGKQLENIKISAQESLSYYEQRKHKTWFDEECSKLLDQRKNAKWHRLQYESEICEDHFNNVMC